MKELLTLCCSLCLIYRSSTFSLHRQKLSRPTRLYSENNKQHRSENIDIFAAPSKKLPNSPTSTISTSNEPEKLVDPTKSSSNIIPPISKSSTLSKVTSNIESQAEFLRLEAERELIEIEQSRLEGERIRLKQLDDVLNSYLHENISIEEILSPNSGKAKYINKDFYFRFIELINYETDSVIKQKLIEQYDQMDEKVRKIDPSLHINIMEDIKKDIQIEENLLKLERKKTLQESGVTKSSYERAVEMWVKQTMNGGGINNTTTTTTSSNNNIFLNPDDESSSLSTSTTDNNFGINIYSSDMNTTNPFNMGLPNVIRFPTTLPALLLPIIFRSSPVSEIDLECLKKSVFTQELLTNITIEASPYLTIFRGKPVDKDFEMTYEKLQARIGFHSSPFFNFNNVNDQINENDDRIILSPGMNERIQVLVLPDYIQPTPFDTPQSIAAMTENAMMEPYSGLKYNPMYVIISNTAKPRPPGGLENAVGLAGFMGALIFSFIYSTDVYSMNKVFVEQVMAGNTETLDRVFTLTLSLLGVQVLHDIGHVLMANLNKVAISLPYFLPSLQIGHFGTITNFLDFTQNRKQLFDISIAGPFLGFLSSLILTIFGLILTQSATPDQLLTFPALPTGFFTSSFFLFELTDQFLHISTTLSNLVNTATTTAINTVGTAPSAINNIATSIASSYTPVHPFVAAGLIGLMTNAFNFMPIGRLDGGRVFMSIFGRKSAQSVATVTLIAQGLGLLVNSNPINLFWILVVVFLQRGQDLPPVDDITPIGGFNNSETKNLPYFLRMGSFIFCLLLAASILIPMPLDLAGLSGAINAVSDSSSTGGGSGVPPGIQI